MAQYGQTPEEQAADEQAFRDWNASQSGYIGKSKKAAWWENRNQQYRQREMEDVLGGKKTGSILSGSPEEQRRQIAGLNLGNVIYGQGLGQAGEDVQRIKEQLRARSELSGADPVTAAIMQQKGSAQAAARREMRQAGVKGMAAAGALESIGKQKDSEIAASLYGQQRQSLADERNMLSNIISGQTGLMFGEKAAAQQLPAAPSGGGMFGTVICTELYRQGYMDLATYSKDSEYGLKILKETPEVIVGYQFLANPIVKLMKKSPMFTKIISYPALKWARHIANEENSIVGVLAVNIGQPICGIIGKLLSNVFGAKYV